MKVYESKDIRNVGVVGHGDSGKTSLTAGLLFTAGATNRLLRVDEGNTITDFDEEEIQRKITISTAIAVAEWKKTKINILDTPGYNIFINDTRGALVAADAALVLVDGVAGVEVQTEKVWSFADDFKLPRAVVINKLDRERADFERALDKRAGDLRPHRRADPDPHRRRARFQGRGRPGPHESLHLHRRWRRQGQGRRDPRRPGRSRPDGPRSAGRNGRRGQRRPHGRVLRKGHAAAPSRSWKACRQGVREMRIFPVLCASALHNVGTDLILELHRRQPARAHRARSRRRARSTARRPTRKIADTEPASAVRVQDHGRPVRRPHHVFQGDYRRGEERRQPAERHARHRRAPGAHRQSRRARPCSRSPNCTRATSARWPS